MALSKLGYAGRIPSEDNVLLTTEQERTIAARVCQHYNEICRILNPVQLLPYLWKEGLLNFEDRTMLLGELSRVQKSRHILKSLKAAEGSLSYSKFLQCIQMETTHMGHLYIVFLLEGKLFGSESERLESSKFREEINKQLIEMMDINLVSLVPLMYRSNLLTLEEHQELLSSRKPERERILLLIQILDTKGPLAHAIFAQCLSEEPSHPTHIELFRLISTSQSTYTHYSSSRKQKRGVNTCMLSRVMRPFQSWKMQRPLKGHAYDKMMQLFQSCHHNGEWEKLDCEAAKYIGCKIIEFQVVALLEKAISWIFRRNEETVVSLIDKAKQICQKIPGENSAFLLGRCEYILSRLFRYLKEYGKAKEHISNAREHLYLVEHGEDSSFVNYCDACIMVECLSESSPPEEIRRVQTTFERAIDDDFSHESGLGLVAPHSLMRLAQMYLGGTHYNPGITCNVENIEQARLCLQAVDYASLCYRSKCHYDLIKSDLYRNTNGFSEAKASLQIVLTLAQKYGFALEISSAETRLLALSNIK